MKKKIFIGLGTLILVVGLVIGGLYFYNSKKENDKFSYLILKINPELMLSFNEENIVIDIKRLNDDASIFKESDLIGLELGKAIDKVVDIALDNGYLEDNILSIIGISNFNGFSTDQAKKFLANRNIKVNESTALEDFGIDCDDETKDLTDTELMICNAYAVTAKQRHDEISRKYDEYQKCLNDMLNGIVRDCGENPIGTVNSYDPSNIEMPLCRDVGKDSGIPCTCGEGVSSEDCYK